MTAYEPFVLTVSRQLGSGGAYLGQRIAVRTGAIYADREILRQAAAQLGMPENELAGRDETVTPFWQTLLQGYALGIPEMGYQPPVQLPPTDREFYRAEAETITRLACSQRSAVIVGRGGFHVLNWHMRHLSVFLHADMEFRLQRVQELYTISAREALALIDSTDRTRARYLQTLTGQDWTDTRQYHLAIDTGMVGLSTAEEIVMTALRLRFGVTAVIIAEKNDLQPA